jgi:type IV pilus assembly protein PilC
MTYPAIVITLSFVVGALFLFVIMPKMAMLLEALNSELPWTTMVIITSADLAAEYGAAAAAVMATLVLLTLWLTRLKRGREIRDMVYLKLPLLGKISLYGEVARLTRNMSLLMGSGLRLSETLALLEPVSGNTIMRNEISGIRFRLLEGQRISYAFSQSRVLPRDVGDIMMVGEETGKLPEALGSIADAYESAADESLTALMGLIEPALTLAMGIGIGFLALAVVTPMYSVAGSFQ